MHMYVCILHSGTDTRHPTHIQCLILDVYWISNASARICLTQYCLRRCRRRCRRAWRLSRQSGGDLGVAVVHWFGYGPWRRRMVLCMLVFCLVAYDSNETWRSSDSIEGRRQAPTDIIVRAWGYRYKAIWVASSDGKLFLRIYLCIWIYVCMHIWIMDGVGRR